MAKTIVTQPRATQPRATQSRATQPILSNPFDEAFVGNQSRNTKYTQWSERAVIVGFNPKIQAYDIIITTEKSTGADKRSLNRTIRQVKSLIPPKDVRFSPGDSVLVGYVADQREHPIIMGQGDNFVQTPLKTTLPNTVTGAASFSEGSSQEGLAGQQFQNACLFNLQDASTGSTETWTVDCDSIDIDGFFRDNIAALCGCGGVTWSVTSLSGCSVSIDPFGPNDTLLKMKPPPNVPGVTETAFLRVVRIMPETCAVQTLTSSFKCDNSLIDPCSGDQLTCFDGAWDAAHPNCLCCDLPFCILAGGACTPPDKCDSDILNVCDDPCSVVIEVCVDCPPVQGAVCDVRTQIQKDAGCCPCSLVEDVFITAEDQCGQRVTIEVKAATS